MPQLSWTHYYQLVDIDDSKKRAFYENKTVQNSRGVREVGSEIKSQLYYNTPKKEIEKVLQTKLPAIEPYEAFKDAYNFNFLGLDELHKERELEDKIILHLEKGDHPKPGASLFLITRLIRKPFQFRRSFRQALKFGGGQVPALD